MATTTEIQLPIETQMKREKLANLKQELAELFEMREHMIYFERPHLIAAYTKLVGEFKYEEFSLKVSVKRQKRKAELIQARINRNEPVIIEEIEKQLDEEFAEYERQLNEQMDAIKAANDYLTSPLLSEEESKELKQVYRLLVKRLHPDWNPDLTQEERDLFVRVQAAYNLADLQELRNILLKIDTNQPLPVDENTIDKDIERYEHSIQDIRQRIEELERTFPFTMRELLSSEDKVKEEQRVIKESIARLREEREKWTVYVSTFLTARTMMGEA